MQHVTTISELQELAELSHEIRAPLAAIRGAAEALRRGALEVADLLDTIDASTKHAISVLDSAIQLADPAQSSVTTDPLDLAAVIEDVRAMYAPIVAERGVALTAHVCPDVPARSRSDAGKIRQVLINLITNAAKFTKRGSISVEVAMSAVSARTAFEIQVRDTGVGIAEHEVPLIFAPFKTLHPPVVGPRGAGLGLAITRRLVEAMDGEIDVRSTPGVGSCFRVVIPCEVVEDVDDEPSSTVRRGATPRNGRCSRSLGVVVVDDDPDACAPLALILDGEGHRVTVASSAADALLAVEQTTPDVVLLDLRLPDGDGLSLARTLRDRGLLPRGGRVIAVTGLTRDSCDVAGSPFDDWLEKPFEVDALLRLLRSA